MTCQSPFVGEHLEGVAKALGKLSIPTICLWTVSSKSHTRLCMCSANTVCAITDPDQTLKRSERCRMCHCRLSTSVEQQEPVL